MQSYPVIVCSDAGKLTNTVGGMSIAGQDRCNTAEGKLLNFPKYIFFFNLDKNILPLIKHRNVPGQHGCAVVTTLTSVSPISGV